jgi:hypothetical protein
MIALTASGVLLALAWFAAVNAAASAVSWVIGMALISSRHRGRTALLLAVRLLPAAASLLLVAAVFLPAYWRLEPRDANESFGTILGVLAAGGAVILIRSAARAIGVARAGRLLRASGQLSRSDPALPTEAVYEVPGLAGVSLAGVLRTRILVGPAVTLELTAQELAVAVDHELAHRTGFDNLNRFAMFCAPDLFGFSQVARRLEEDWRAAAESLADARAVNGDPMRALHLASALVKVARLGTGSPAVPLSPAWSTLHDPPLLETRVRRLVSGGIPAARKPRVGRAVGAAMLAAVGLLIGGAAAAEPVHQLTEALVRVLP